MVRQAPGAYSFTRLTNAFSKKVEINYNFARLNATLTKEAGGHQVARDGCRI